MNRFHACAVALTLGFFSLAPQAVRASESYDNCTGFITSLPAVITTPGTWCLNHDLTTAITSGNAVLIKNSDVSIDCNDFMIDGRQAGLATRAHGIVSTNHFSEAVRHCDIRGFFDGIVFISEFFPHAGKHVVEDNRFEGNTFTGIHVEGDGSMIRRNRVLDTGRSTQTTSANGITTAYSVDIEDNTVDGVCCGTANGIYTNLDEGGSITGNRVRIRSDNVATKGISNGSNNRITLRDNNLVSNAAPGSYGLVCSGHKDSIKNNTISGFANAYLTCENGGGNVVVP